MNTHDKCTSFSANVVQKPMMIMIAVANFAGWFFKLGLHEQKLWGSLGYK